MMPSRFDGGTSKHVHGSMVSTMMHARDIKMAVDAFHDAYAVGSATDACHRCFVCPETVPKSDRPIYHVRRIVC